MKNKKKMVLALISVLSLSTLTFSVFADNPAIDSNSEGSVTKTQKEQRLNKHGSEMVDEPENAIGKNAAVSKALDDAGVTEDQAGKIMSHLSQLEDGTVVYKVHFIYNDQHYFYQINAISGEIVEKNNEAVSEDNLKKSGRHGKHFKEEVDEPENAIGKNAAVSKALDDAGVTEEQAGKVMSHLSQLEDGTVVYKVHFIYNDQHYSYQINATSGEIVEKNNEAVSEDNLKKSGRFNKENKSTTTDSFTEAAYTVA